MYGKHPYATPTVRKQHPRKVQWRSTGPAFDPSLVSRTLSPQVAQS